jgi:hypothetical protein
MEWLGEGVTVVQRIPRHIYFCRPPAVPHEPFRSAGGCLLLAMFYYPPRGRRPPAATIRQYLVTNEEGETWARPK